jgi:flagella basal body P-ring formation protein FlgA
MKTAIFALTLSLAWAQSLASDPLADLLMPLDQMRPAVLASVAPKSAPVPQAEATVAENSSTAPAPVFLTLKEILPEVQAVLKTRFAPEGELAIDCNQPWRAVKVPGEAWSVELLRVSGQELAPRIVATVRIKCNDVSYGDYQLQLSCTLMREVLVSTRHINKAEALDSASFQLQLRDVLEGGQPVPSGTDLAQSQARNSIAAGQVLSWRDVEIRPTMRRGQIVEVVAVEGRLRVTTKAMVLEDGRTGEMIAVRNLSSNKDIRARIVNERTVEVYF